MQSHFGKVLKLLRENACCKSKRKLFDLERRVQYNLKITLFIVLFSLLHANCKSKTDLESDHFINSTSEQRSVIPQETTSLDDKETASLFYSLRSDNPQEISKAKAQLLEISEKSSNEKAQVITQLINETTKLCKGDDVMYSDTDFDQLQQMSNLLASFQSIEALDVLIECSNHTLAVVDGSSSDYATLPAIIKYKEKALPTLKKKLKSSRKEIKCQVASALSELGGSEAERSLKEASKNETEEMVLDCFHRCIKSFDNNS